MSFRATAMEAGSRRLISRLVLFCLLGVIGTGVLPTLLMRAAGWGNGFWTIANMWRGEGGGDAWGPISLALQHLDTYGSKEFYQALYYNSDQQFIYSPLSLIFFRLTQFPPFIDWYSKDAMNHVS